MNIDSVQSSFFRYLYDNFEVPSGIKIFESVYYVDFKTFDKWIVLDQLGNTAGPLPTASFYLHCSIKNGLLNETVVLNRLVDSVTNLIYPMKRLDVYNGSTGVLVGEMEIVETNLLPVLQHAGGGSYRSLGVSLAYAGELGS